jgi:hypothetical protein
MQILQFVYKNKERENVYFRVSKDNIPVKNYFANNFHPNFTKKYILSKKVVVRDKKNHP